MRGMIRRARASQRAVRRCHPAAWANKCRRGARARAGCQWRSSPSAPLCVHPPEEHMHLRRLSLIALLALSLLTPLRFARSTARATRHPPRERHSRLRSTTFSRGSGSSRSRPKVSGTRRAHPRRAEAARHVEGCARARWLGRGGRAAHRRRIGKSDRVHTLRARLRGCDEALDRLRR